MSRVTPGRVFPILLALASSTASADGPHRSASTCSITDFGAVSGNRTVDARANAAAVERALASCGRVTVPAGVFKLAPITLPSHTVLDLAAGSVLTGSDDWRDYLPAIHFMPPAGNSGTQPGQLQLTPLISALGAINISISGGNGTIDGNGWYAWPSANWSSPECGEHNRCAGPTFFGEPPTLMRPPHVLTFTHCANTSLANVTITNPAYWGIQHFFSNVTTMDLVTILAPRWTREIAGFMPFSVRQYAVADSYVEVGDDAVAIMSGPDWADGECSNASAKCPVANWSYPTADVSFRRLFVRGRSVAIGSEDFGNVTNVIFDNCTIGDDAGSAPWAFKIKMHSNVGCRVGDIAVTNTRLGRIAPNTWQDPPPSGGVAILMAMAYNDPPIRPDLPQPRISNISFINVTAASTVAAGELVGGLHNISAIHFENCDFRSSDARTPWRLTGVDVATCTSVNTTPAFPGRL